MRHQPRPSLVQIVACRLFGAEPLSERMLYYCQLDPQEQISVKLFSKFKYFHSRKFIWKCRLENVGHFSRPQCVKDRDLQSMMWESQSNILSKYQRHLDITLHNICFVHKYKVDIILSLV